MESTTTSVGSDVVDRGDDAGQRALGRRAIAVRQGVEPFGPEPHLAGRLLGADVEHPAPWRAIAADDLQQQGGLADPRLAPEEGDRAGYEPTAEHTVELADAGRQRRRRVEVDLADRQRRDAAVADPSDRLVPDRPRSGCSSPRTPRTDPPTPVPSPHTPHTGTPHAPWPCGDSTKGQ